MSMIGADVEQLAGLGRTLSNQVQTHRDRDEHGRQRAGQHPLAGPGARRASRPTGPTSS